MRPGDDIVVKTYLLQTPWACNTVAEFIARASRGVAVRQEGKHTIDSVQLIRGFGCWVRRSIIN